MAPISGKLQADFASFYEACQKAEVSLQSFDAGSLKVQKRLNAMTDGFSGRRVIQEATLMAKAIERAGGVSALTSRELIVAGNTAAEAAEKMRALGMEVPAGFNEIAEAGQKASRESTNLGGSLRQVDNMLSAVGINIGSKIKGLEQMGRVSGQTASQIGLVATAAAVAGAAIAGWNIGRWIADLTGADKAVADLTTRLTGWGDVAAETAGAQQDVINRAIANGAKETIKFKDAIAFNAKALRDAGMASIDWEARLRAAQGFVADLTEEELRQIQIARDLGASQDELRVKFGLTADSVVALDARLKEQSEAMKQHEAAAKKLAEEAERMASKVVKAAEENAKKFANLEAENTALALSMTGTRLQVRLAAIDAEYQAEVAKLNKLDPQYRQYLANLDTQRELKKQREMAGYDEVNAHSRTRLDERAAYEQATLEYMISSHGEFSSTAIAHQRDIVDAAREAARNWQDAWRQSTKSAMTFFEEVSAKAQVEAQRINDFMQYGPAGKPKDGNKTVRLLDGTYVTPEEAARRKESGGSFQIGTLTATQLKQVNEQYNPFGLGGGQGGNEGLLARLRVLEAKEGTYAPKNREQYLTMLSEDVELQRLRMTARELGLPGFKSGVTNFEGGLARVHQDELLVNLPPGTDVIPAGRRGSGGTVVQLGGVHFHGPTLGSATDIEKLVKQGLEQLMRRSGMPARFA